MKKEEPRTEILFIRTTKSIKDFISRLAFGRFGVKRKEAIYINQLLEELRDYSKVSVKEK